MKTLLKIACPTLAFYAVYVLACASIKDVETNTIKPVLIHNGVLHLKHNNITDDLMISDLRR